MPGAMGKGREGYASFDMGMGRGKRGDEEGSLSSGGGGMESIKVGRNDFLIFAMILDSGGLISRDEKS